MPQSFVGLALRPRLGLVRSQCKTKAGANQLHLYLHWMNPLDFFVASPVINPVGTHNREASTAGTHVRNNEFVIF